MSPAAATIRAVGRPSRIPLPALAVASLVLVTTALVGVVLIPVSFAAIRLAKEFLHPRVFTLHGPNFGGWILVTYCVAQAALLVLAYTLYRVEIAGKRLDARLRDLREVLA